MADQNVLFRERFLVSPSYSIIQLQTQYARLSSIPHAPFRLPSTSAMWDGARMVLMVRSRGGVFPCLNVGSSGIRRKGRSRGAIRKGDAVGWRKVLQFPKRRALAR